MGREVVNTRFLALNVTKDPKNLQMSELSDSLNMRLRKTGEYERRPGVRPSGESTRLQNSAVGVPEVFNDTKRPKYLQVFTAGRESLEIFAVGNRVFIYDQALNKFTLLYEAPGNAPVDIASYLGFVLVTSHTSNLAILKPYERRSYILNRGVRLIKSQGSITGNAIDFEEEDVLEDSDIQDFCVDQSSLLTASLTNVGTQVSSVSPSGQEISNLVWSADNRYKSPVSVFLSADRRTGNDAVSHNVNGMTLADQEFGNILFSDFTNGEVTKPFTFKRRAVWTISDAGGGNVAISGGLFNGSAITSVNIRRMNGSTILFNQCSDGAFISNVPGDGYIVYTDKVKISHFDDPGTNSGNGNTTFEGDGIMYLGGNVLRIWKPNGSLFTVTLTTTDVYPRDVYSFGGSRFAPTIDNRNRLDNAFKGKKFISHPSAGQGGAGQRELGSNIIWKRPEGDFSYWYRATPNWNASVTEKHWAVNIDGSGEYLFKAIAGGRVAHAFGSTDFSFNASFDDFAYPRPSDYQFFLMVNSLLGNSTTAVVDSQTGSLVLRPLRPYYRVDSQIVGRSSKQDVNVAEPWRFNGNVTYINNSLVSQRIEVSFDVAYAHSEDELEYLLTPPGTNIKRFRVKKFNKDNLDIRESLVDLYGSNETFARVAKLREILILHTNADGTFFVGVRRSVDKVEIFAEFDLSDYGTMIDLKNIVDHDGRLLAVLLTDLGLYIFRISFGIIEEVTRYTTGFATDIKDFVPFVDANHTDIYCIRDGTPTTFFVRIVDLDGEPTFDGTEYSTLIDYRINYPSALNNPRFLLFVTDNEGSNRLVADDTAGTPTDVNRYLEFTVNGLTPTVWDKVLSDQSLNGVLQVRPVSTPVPPDVSSAPGLYDRTGRFFYFWVVKEKDSGGGVIYESYGSDYSIIATASSQTIELALISKYQQNQNADTVDITIFRAELRTSDTRVKVTDFTELESTPLTENPAASGLWELTVPWVDHFVSDDIDFVPAGGDAIDGHENYRGYTRFYPRCKFVAVQENVVYLLNDSKYRNNIYFAPLFDPTQWLPQNTISAEVFAKDEISAYYSHNGLWVFTRDTTGLVTGIGSNVAYQVVTHEVGCVDNRTIKVIGGSIWMLTEKGLYSSQGYSFRKFDESVSRITDQFVFESAIVAFGNPYDLEYKIIYDRNKILCYSVPLNRWFLYEYPYDIILYGFNRENPETDIAEQILVVRNEEPGIGNVYRLMVEDNYTVYDYLNGEGENVQTADDVMTSFTTKQMDMSNGYAEKIFRRIHGEFIKSHDIKGEISVNEGAFIEMIEQTRRSRFNDVPNVWHRFNELFGRRITDFGRRGFVSTAFGDYLRNQDGKIDRTIMLRNGAYVNLGDIRQMPDGASIMFWFNQVDNGITKPIAFSDLAVPNQSSLLPGDRLYEREDFLEPMIDSDGATGDIEEIQYAGGVYDSLGALVTDSFGDPVYVALGDIIYDSNGDPIRDSFGEYVVDSDLGPVGQTTIKSTNHGWVLPGISFIVIKGLDPSVDGDYEVLREIDADFFIIDAVFPFLPAAGRWSRMGDFNDVVVALSTSLETLVKCGLYSWKSVGPMSNVEGDLRAFVGQDTGPENWWSDLINVNPDAGSVTLELPSGTWDNFSNLPNAMRQMRLPNLGVGSMLIPTTFTVGP